VIAGVPPDLFSESGQRWGNPHYRWDVMAQERYRWWIERIRHTLTQVASCASTTSAGLRLPGRCPLANDTAANGQWVAGPGPALFQAVEAVLGQASHHCRGPGGDHAGG